MAGPPSGNRNAAKGYRWHDAIHRALTRYCDPEQEVAAGRALDKIAEKLVKAALKGDQYAITEIGNRLDGKAAQSLTVGGDPDAPLEFNHRVTFVGRPGATGKA
jgi:hypothetical protein